MTVTLPQQFQDTMRELLAEEYQDYIKSMEEPSHTALRVNTHKNITAGVCRALSVCIGACGVGTEGLLL